MKRVLSIFLCIVMCFSVFGMTGAQAYALSSTADEHIRIEREEISGNKITYTLSLAPNQTKVSGFILKVNYDSNILKVSDLTKKTGALNNDGEYEADVPGIYETGEIKTGTDGINQFVISYCHTSGYNVGDNPKTFFKVVFEVVGDERPITDIEFFYQEFFTDDGNDENDINPDGTLKSIVKDSVVTLSATFPLEVASTETGLKVTWIEVDGADEYVIYRKPVDGEWSELTRVTAPAYEYVDESIEKGVEYYYTVASSNSYGATPYDEEGLIGMCFGTVTSISGEMIEKGAKIEWNALDYVSKYTVHRKTADTDWITVGETTETSYEDNTLKSGVTYFYTIKAYHTSGKYIAETSVPPYEVYYISAPDMDGALYQISPDAITVNWTVVAGATGYEVFRKAETDAEYVSVGETEANAYTDTDVTEGVTYYYKALSVSGDIKSAVSSDYLSVKKLAVVATPVATMGYKSVKVTWEGVSSASQYKVYRKANTGNWIPLDTVDAAEHNEYIDNEVKSGYDYTYSIATLSDGFMTEKSNPSEPVCYLDSPDTSGMTAVINADSILIDWVPVNGAAEYKVYRKTNGDADYKFVAKVTEAQYDDTLVEDGQVYSYKVVSLGKGLESELTDSAFTVTKIGVVKNVKAKLGVKEITVSWDAAQGATAYKIYRQSPGYGLMYITTVNGDVTQYSDIAVENGVSYSYAVVSTDGVAQTVKSTASNEVRYLDAPIITKTENTDEGLSITFAAVTGSSNYKIYRKTVNGTFQFVGETTASKTTFVDESAVSGQKYIYGVAACYGETESPIFESEVVCRLVTPKLTLSAEYNGVKLSWKAVPGAEKYVIEHKITGYPYDIVTTIDGSKTSYLHKEAVDGARNHYTIYAVSGNSKSIVSESKYDFVEGPTIKSFTTQKGGVELKWTATEYAEKYYIYRKTSSSGAWSKIGTSTKTSYKDTKVSAGKTYYYTIVAEDDYGECSAKNEKGWSTKCLVMPASLKASNVNGGIKVTWAKVSGASTYVVYRKAGSAKSWTKVATVKTNSYTDKTAKSGTTYKYTVKATYGSLTNSKYNTTGVSLKCVGTPQVKLSNGTSGISVTWGKITGATKYDVYRKAGSAKSWTKVATVKTNSYTDKSVKSGTTYKYMVKAYSGTLASSYNSSGWTIKRLAAPKLSGVTSAKSGVTVKWGKVTGAEKYCVYRKTGSGKFVKIATVNGNKKFTYLDKTAKKGTTYTYTVQAYSGSYKSSYYSGLKIKDKY